MVYVFLAEGFEETEAVATLDMLRRGNVECKFCSLEGRAVEGSRGITVEADTAIDSIKCEEIDAVVLPGGMPGTLNLEKNTELSAIIDKIYNDGKLIAAICAAPTILLHRGMLSGKKATVYPSFKNEMLSGGVCYEDSKVSKDGNIITASGPDAAIEFGLAIVEYLKDAEIAKQVRATL